MTGPRIVTALVLISLSVGCKAKFRKVNGPAAEPTASANGPQNPSTAQNPQTPPPSSNGPQVPTGPVGKNPPPFAPPATLPPKPGRSCLTQDDDSLDRSRAIQHKTITFNRGRQLVERRDCSGRLISKKVEVLNNDMMKNIAIRPAGGAGAMHVYNRNTCHSTSSQNTIPVSTSGEYRFTVSTKKSDFAMFVKPGQNFIDYQIGAEKGTLVLTVRESHDEMDCVVIRPSGCGQSI